MSLIIGAWINGDLLYSFCSFRDNLKQMDSEWFR